jgi:hypothetical protein
VEEICCGASMGVFINIDGSEMPWMFNEGTGSGMYNAQIVNPVQDKSTPKSSKELNFILFRQLKARYSITRCNFILLIAYEVSI